jgi:hypothetical protein
MLGTKERDFKVHPKISLNALVPQDNFYRHVESCVDLSFVREPAAESYADIGRPSIDPVVFFKLQLVAFFEGFRSERQSMEMVNLNLAHRWFIGYDLDEVVPDHSPHRAPGFREETPEPGLLNEQLALSSLINIDFLCMCPYQIFKVLSPIGALLSNILLHTPIGIILQLMRTKKSPITFKIESHTLTPLSKRVSGHKISID